MFSVEQSEDSALEVIEVHGRVSEGGYGMAVFGLVSGVREGGVAFGDLGGEGGGYGVQFDESFCEQAEDHLFDFFFHRLVLRHRDGIGIGASGSELPDRESFWPGLNTGFQCGGLVAGVDRDAVSIGGQEGGLV